MVNIVRRLSRDGITFKQYDDDVYQFYADGIVCTEGSRDYIARYVQDVSDDWMDNTVVLIWQEFLEMPLAGCVHSWFHYVGFTEIYDFCQKCDVKRI